MDPHEANASDSHRPWRITYSKRDETPGTNAVTRQLAGIMHERVNRIGQARDLLGRWQDRTLGRREREIRQLPDVVGEQLAAWSLENVLNARKRPVPSFGFSLAPVLTHAVAARRQQRIRGLLLTSAIALVTARHPWGTGTLAAMSVLYHVFVVAGRFSALVRWGLSALVPMAVTAAVALLAWTKLKEYSGAVSFAVQDAVSAGVWLTLLLTALYALDGWIALGYALSLRPAREHIARRPRLAPRAATKVAECETTELWQSTPYLKEATGWHRFVGAGLDPWRSGGPRIQLTPARRATDDAGEGEGSDGAAKAGGGREGIRKFESDELLDKVRDELERLSGTLVETHALPHCDVFETLAVPQARWQSLPRVPDRPQLGLRAESSTAPERATWPEAGEMIAEGRQAPSGHLSRRYLAAQVVDWEGQTVVTVFAHAALEGKTLHFVTRPHVLASLRKEVRAETVRGWTLARKIALMPVHALGDTIALAHRSYGILLRVLISVLPGVFGHAVRQQVAKALDADEKPRVDGTPVSLREHCALVEPEDMHQAEDAARHISILQSRMFSTVSAFLDDHGVSTGEFRRQAEQFVTKVFINGDHNQVNTGTVHGDQTQAKPADDTTAKG
ncbi:hypothetical protein [Streptomyces longispororuber]|uniref:hypothetical protein n=1 Tax=Streptomyces longispororuber TaxID=68230 RepID=UPI002109828D|nr:hypothetical protein [Streptomyces longispororuber]MCQ4210405.1 hypothetical protein [Streptomyces longispororuber]